MSISTVDLMRIATVVWPYIENYHNHYELMHWHELSLQHAAVIFNMHHGVKSVPMLMTVYVTLQDFIS